VGGALGDPDRGGDVAQADSRVMSRAHKDVGVVCQKVPVSTDASEPCWMYPENIFMKT
jgi:hypothetical protein